MYAPRSVIDNTAVQSGPFGYTDKGSFFSDMAVTEFPKWIEVIYQGFVWAIRVTYPSNGSLMHGGVHTILKDKVKKQKFFLKDGEHIVRVSGRASPYNINRCGQKLPYYPKNIDYVLSDSGFVSFSAIKRRDSTWGTVRRP